MSTSETRERGKDARKHVQTNRLRQPSRERLATVDKVSVVDDLLIVMTQAFCHHGHPLVTPDNPRFDGFPGVRVRVKALGAVQDVILSPIHGHHDRRGGEGLPDHVKCEVRCPTCSESLPVYNDCPCGVGQLRTIFLTPERADAHVAAICDVWGCHRSRVMDEFEILSEFVDLEA